VLDLQDPLNLSDTSNQLTVEGGSTDSVEMTSGTWSLAENVGGYDVYTLGEATLRVDTAITDVTIDAVT